MDISTLPVPVDFQSRLETVFRDDLGWPAATEASQRITSFLQAGAPGREIQILLSEWGLRVCWNDVLARQRSRQLAAHVVPFLSGHVFDILAGDGSLTDEVSRLHQGPVTAWERRGAYPEYAEYIHLVDDPSTDITGQPETLLVSTVLHHEPDATKFLQGLRNLDARRWVIVENSIHDDVPEEYHFYMDVFFNQCLNSFDVDCTTEHRTMGGWRDLLAAFGHVDHTASLGRMPGMPFPYELFVVETNR